MEIIINRNNPIPLYYQLKEEIKKEIINKDLAPGTKIITEEKLISEYNLSYPTVTRALRELVYEGFLERIQGKGTFVVDREKKLLTIGLVIPHFHISGDLKYFIPIVGSIEDGAKKNDINMLFCLDNDEKETEAKNLSSLLARKVDGIIIFYIGGENNKRYIKEIKDTGIPVVLIDRYIEDIETDYVRVDNVKGAYEATKFLLNKGIKNIFHFTNNETCSTVSQRIEGFKNALAEHNVMFDESLIRRTGAFLNQEEDAYNLAKDMLNNINLPFGIFAVNFPILNGVWNAIKEKGIRYGDFSLACFDESLIDIPEGVSFIEILQPLEEIGRKSVQIIIDKLKGKKGTQQIILQPISKIVNEGKKI